MRVLAGWCALALALLRPPSDIYLPQPAQPGPDLLQTLDRLVNWNQPPPPVGPEESPLTGGPAPLDCCCPRLQLPVGEAAFFFLCGLLVWPALDLLWLLKLAWQRRVAALSRALQVRPPDRP